MIKAALMMMIFKEVAPLMMVIGIQAVLAVTMEETEMLVLAMILSMRVTTVIMTVIKILVSLTTIMIDTIAAQMVIKIKILVHSYSKWLSYSEY